MSEIEKVVNHFGRSLASDVVPHETNHSGGAGVLQLFTSDGLFNWVTLSTLLLGVAESVTRLKVSVVKEMHLARVLRMAI